MGDSASEVVAFVLISCIDGQNEIISRPSAHSSPKQAGDDNVDNLLFFRNMWQLEHFDGAVGFRHIDSIRIIFCDGVLRIIVTDADVVELAIIAVQGRVAIFDTVGKSLELADARLVVVLGIVVFVECNIKEAGSNSSEATSGCTFFCYCLKAHFDLISFEVLTEPGILDTFYSIQIGLDFGPV